MTENDSSPADSVLATGPPGIPGIIEGSMTVHAEPDGSVSFRVVIGSRDEYAGKRDVLELIIGAEHVRSIGRALADGDATIIGYSEPVRTFPCHIGFCRNAVGTAA